jgi:hypothetical protein
MSHKLKSCRLEAETLFPMFNFLKYSYFNIKVAELSFWFFGCFCLRALFFVSESFWKPKVTLPVSYFKTLGSSSTLLKFLGTLRAF